MKVTAAQGTLIEAKKKQEPLIVRKKDRKEKREKVRGGAYC